MRRTLTTLLTIAVVGGCSGGSGSAGTSPVETTAAVPAVGTEDDLRAQFKAYDEAFIAGDNAAIYDMYSAHCREKYRFEEISALTEAARTTTKKFYDLDPAEVHNSDPEIEMSENSAKLTYQSIGPDGEPVFPAPSKATWIFEDGEWVRDSCEFTEQLGIGAQSGSTTATTAAGG